MILNETAVKYMGLKHPVGQRVKWWDRSLTVIGVVKDMVMGSPFEPIKPAFFYISPGTGYFLNVRISPTVSTGAAIQEIESACKRYAPSEPFTYLFADQQYAKKFASEERVGKLAGFFAVLAVFISCLGLFGMASFVAEQRTKEIGIRKVLGATTLNLWTLLTRDFVLLVIISLIIAIPAAYYFMDIWLQNYPYRSGISGWIFVMAALGALAITLLTVSFQSIKAALANPVNSIKAE